MKKKTLVYLMIVAFILAGGAWFYFSGNASRPSSSLKATTLNDHMSEYVNKAGQTWRISKGEFTFQVTSATEFPRITSGKVDPLDVRVGDTQKMSIVVIDKKPLRSVFAEIETDNGTTTIPMRLTETKAYAQSPGEMLHLFPQLSAIFVKTADAANESMYTYEASWIVKDTHAETYHTRFVVQSDYNEKKDEVTLAWSDPACSWNSTGSLLGSCNPSSGAGQFAEGMDNKILFLNGNTITLTGGAYLIYTPGYNIQVGSGKIVISSGYILQGRLCMIDSDGDNFPAYNLNLTYCNYEGGGYRFQSSMGYPTSIDCNDASYSATNSCGPVCSGNPSVSASESGSSGTITLSASASAATACTMSYVNFYIDGTYVGQSYSGYSITYNSSSLSNSSHYMYAIAYDTSGHSAQSSNYSFTINNSSCNSSVYFPSMPAGCSSILAKTWAPAYQSYVSSGVDPYTRIGMRYSKYGGCEGYGGFYCGGSSNMYTSSYACGTISYGESAESDCGSVCSYDYQVYCKYQ